MRTSAFQGMQTNEMCFIQTFQLRLHITFYDIDVCTHLIADIVSEACMQRCRCPQNNSWHRFVTPLGKYLSQLWLVGGGSEPRPHIYTLSAFLSLSLKVRHTPRQIFITIVAMAVNNSTGFAGARPMQNGDHLETQTAVPETTRPENEPSGPWPSQKVLHVCVRHSQLGNSCNYQRPIFGFVQEKFAQKVCNFQLYLLMPKSHPTSIGFVSGISKKNLLQSFKFSNGWYVTRRSKLKKKKKKKKLIFLKIFKNLC